MAPYVLTSIILLFDKYVNSNILYHADDLYQIFTEIYMLFISINNHCSIFLVKNNIINGGEKIPISAF